MSLKEDVENQERMDQTVDEILRLLNEFDPNTTGTKKVKFYKYTLLNYLSGLEMGLIELVASKIKEKLGITKASLLADVLKIKREMGDNEGSEGKNKGVEGGLCAYFPGLVDIVSHEERAVFLIKEESKLIIKDSTEIDNKIYYPPKNLPWKLCYGELVITNYQLFSLDPEGESKRLYDDLFIYYKSISELPSEDYYHLLVAWTFHTYLTESVQYTPIICLYAVPERGKSRTGKGMIYVAYRGIHVLSLREAYILRACHDLHATLFFDVMDVWDKAEKNGTEDIILSRYEKGLLVPRVIYPERGPHKDTIYYCVFGPTVIATNEFIHWILETRGVQINMPESNRNFKDDIKPESGECLKERLLAFRAYCMDKSLPEVDKPVCGRLGDITRPLMQIMRIVRPENEKILVNLIYKIERARLLEKSEGLEANIILVVIDLEDEVDGGKLSIEAITQRLNEGQPDNRKFRNQTIGRKLSALGFEKTRMAGGKMAIFYDMVKIKNISQKYGITPSENPSQSSQSSQEDTQDNGYRDRNEQSEGNSKGAGWSVEDSVSEFFDSCCGENPKKTIPDWNLYKTYKAIYRDEAVSLNKFNQRLKEMGIEYKERDGKIFWHVSFKE